MLLGIITVQVSEKMNQDKRELERSIITMLYICKNALFVFKISKTQLKHLLIKTLFSNCKLNGENPRCVTVTPLSGVLKTGSCLEWQMYIDDLRTHNSTEVISLYRHLPEELRSAFGCDGV